MRVIAINYKLLLAAGLGLCTIAVIVFIVLNSVSGVDKPKVAVDYFNGLIVDGYTFRVLNSSNDIPYVNGNLKDPSEYSGLISSPVTEKWPFPGNNSSLDSVRLYTWSEKGGLLIGWDTGIIGDKVVTLNARLIDVGVGNYKVNNESLFVPGKGLNLSGSSPEDVFNQYGRLYEGHTTSLINEAMSYFDALTVEGHTFKVLNSSDDIPYKEGNLRDTGNYSRFIHLPSVKNWPSNTSGDYGANSVRLYTWSEKDGLLIGWDLVISNGSVKTLNANLMDIGVGDYQRGNESLFIPELGLDVAGPTADDIFGQYHQLYDERHQLFDLRLTEIHGVFSLWQMDVFSHMVILDVENKTEYALEPGYLYDDIVAVYNYDRSNEQNNYQLRNVTAWGYASNESSYFKKFLPSYEQRPNKAFYVSYYTFGG